MPGSLRLCAGCVAVPGHQPPSRLDHDGRPVGSKTDKPPLLGITADGNNKTCKFPRTGSVLEKAAKRQFFDFFPKDDKQFGEEVKNQARHGWVLVACLFGSRVWARSMLFLTIVSNVSRECLPSLPKR